MKGRKLTGEEKRKKLEEDASERRKIFRELCEHVSKGYSLDCFGVISANTIRKYLTVYPEEFLQEDLDEAMRKGKHCWEDIGRRQAIGECLGNSRTWYYNMANRYGWREKLEVEAEHKGQVQVNVVSYATQKALESSEEEQQP